MSILSFLNPVGGVIGAAEGVANIIDKFVETDDEKRAAETLKAKMMMAPSMAQIELNKIEASHRSIFIAGWRPFIGWICGLALAWHFMLYDLISFFISTPLPTLAGTESLISIVMSLLGLGAFRSIEKIQGKSK
tara:strand:+ start:1382 stop:1783 length:402 start_codon:yes stop_codon:yes gene_type:complete